MTKRTQVNPHILAQLLLPLHVLSRHCLRPEWAQCLDSGCAKDPARVSDLIDENVVVERVGEVSLVDGCIRKRVRRVDDCVAPREGMQDGGDDGTAAVIEFGGGGKVSWEVFKEEALLVLVACK